MFASPRPGRRHRAAPAPILAGALQRGSPAPRARLPFAPRVHRPINPRGPVRELRCNNRTAHARDAQASVRARDVEEPGAVGRADTNVFHRRSLPHGKVGGLCPGNRGKTRCGPEEKALNELHSDLQSFETLGAELACLTVSRETPNHLDPCSPDIWPPTGSPPEACQITTGAPPSRGSQYRGPDSNQLNSAPETVSGGCFRTRVAQWQLSSPGDPALFLPRPRV